MIALHVENVSLSRYVDAFLFVLIRSRGEYGRSTGASLGEMEDHLTCIRQLFNDDEKEGKKSVRCVPHNPIVTWVFHWSFTAKKIPLHSPRILRWLILGTSCRLFPKMNQNKSFIDPILEHLLVNCLRKYYSQNSSHSNRQHKCLGFSRQIFKVMENPKLYKCVN